MKKLTAEVNKENLCGKQQENAGKIHNMTPKSCKTIAKD